MTPLDADTLRVELAAQRAAIERTETGLARKASSLSVAAVVGAIGIAFGGFFALRNEARAQVDAGLSVQRQREDVLRGRVDGLEEQLRRLEAKQDRSETKLDLVLDALRVPAYARPQQDGGK